MAVMIRNHHSKQVHKIGPGNGNYDKESSSNADSCVEEVGACLETFVGVGVQYCTF